MFPTPWHAASAFAKQPAGNVLRHANKSRALSGWPGVNPPCMPTLTRAPLRNVRACHRYDRTPLDVEASFSLSSRRAIECELNR